MGKEAARVWLVKASLIVTTLTFVFFIVAPAFNFPLSFGEAIRLLEIVAPVFLGYLGSATQFLFLKDRRAGKSSGRQ